MTGQDIFDTLSKYLEENESTWKECVGLCTDGAQGRIKAGADGAAAPGPPLYQVNKV